MDKQRLLLNEATAGNESDSHTQGKHRVESEEVDVALLQESKALGDYMDIPTILPILQSHQLVTSDEYMHLLTRWDKGFHKTTVGILLQLLPRKHPNWALLVFESLQAEKEHRGHSYLVDLLRKSMQEHTKVKCLKHACL